MNKQIVIIALFFGSLEAMECSSPKIWKRPSPSAFIKLSSLADLKKKAAGGNWFSKYCLIEWRKVCENPTYQIKEKNIIHCLYNLHLIERNGKLPEQLIQKICPQKGSHV